MKLKYMFVFLMFGMLLMFFVGSSFALDEETINEIEMLENKELDIKLENIEDYDEVHKFIDLIDDSLIPTASFNMSDVLNDNYDFLSVFAINFILNNEEYYKNDIVYGENYVYDSYGYKYETNKYIDINKIYDITYNILGKKDYYIVNDYLKIENNLVPLLLLNNYSFLMEIDSIVDIVKFSEKYEVIVKYKDIDITYKYIFEKLNDNYIINNILVY